MTTTNASHAPSRRPFAWARGSNRAGTTRLAGAAAALAAAIVLAACGSSDGPVGGATTPALVAHPTSGTVVVGQLAAFHVEAEGENVSYGWQEQRPGGAWLDSDGTVFQQPGDGGSGLVVGPVEITRDETRLRAVASNAAGSIASNEARLDVVWGIVETLDSNLGLGPGAGGFGSADGGTPGGGDGEGAGVGGGLGKTTQAQIAITRVADGAPLGSATTGATSGLVRLKAGPGAGPLLITLTGSGAARYFDEGRGSMLALDAAQPPLHALVTSVDRHLGVTALTEAAYRYAINNFVLDPAAVRARTVPLARGATPEQIARLTAAQVQLAHEAIRSEVNRLLPARHHLDAVTTLPTPVDDTSGAGSITTNIYGTMQAVTGGLALAAANFNASLGTPALTITQQLADDLTDGVVDGLALDGSSVFGAPGAAYGPGSLAGFLTGAADALMSSLGDGVAPPAPVITAQPVATSIVGTASATLSVEASGSALNYQWLSDDGEGGFVPVDGGTGPTLSVSVPGDYVVRISNAGGDVTSDPASVSRSTTAAAPAITTQPQSASVVAGESASFTVVATGTNLRWQWRNVAGPIAGATAPTFTTGTAGTYSVDVSNDLGTVRSAAVTLTVTPLVAAPTITRQPVSQTGAPARPATLSVAASGHGLAFQWLGDAGPIAGAVASTFTTSRAGSYRVTVANAAGEVTSNVATVTAPPVVTPEPPPPPPPPPTDVAPPAITAQPPASSAIFEGQTVTLTVQATGTALQYQWRRDGVDIAGATGPSHTAGTAGSYTVRVFNAAGSVTSNAAVVTVAGAPVITDQPDSATLAAGATVTLAVTATGQSLSYQWQREVTAGGTAGFEAISGATTAAYTTGTAGRYRVLVSNPAGTATSAVAVVTVVAAPPPVGGPIEPLPYRSLADSPFGAVRFTAFHLEDWADRVLNTPGASANTAVLSSSFGASLVDSVDGDDGSVDGTCAAASGRCDALWGSGRITVTFDAAALGGRLPDFAGLVVTDAGATTVTVEAFDAAGVSLGSRSASYPSGVTGDVTDDRFFGFVALQGIQRIEVRAEGGLEIDHLQYGLSDPGGSLRRGGGGGSAAR